MENNKQTSTLKNKIFKMAASVSLTFQNPPFSPGRDHKSRTHGGKGFSGPMIPQEARRKPKGGHGGGGIETQEPTSPKVSCMGQIKHKKKQIEKAKAKTMSIPTTHNRRYSGGVGGDANSASSTPRETENEVKNKKQHAPNKFQRMFFHAAKPKTGSRKKKLSDSSFVVGEENINKSGVSSDRAPPVGQMKRFASGRETFSNFDWRAQIAPEEMDHRDCFTDDDRAVESDAEEEDEDDDVIIPFSAPILGGGGRGSSGLNLQPRKEINLWKRRTMTPPMPLQLKPVLTAK